MPWEVDMVPLQPLGAMVLLPPLAVVMEPLPLLVVAIMRHRVATITKGVDMAMEVVET